MIYRDSSDFVRGLTTMKLPQFILLFSFIALVLPGRAEDKANLDANLMLAKASDLEALRGQDLQSLRRVVHFTFVNSAASELKGEISFEEAAPDKSRVDLELGGYQRHEVRSGRTIWILANSPFMPLPMRELRYALNWTQFQLAPADVVKSVRDRKIGRADARCIYFETIRGKESENGLMCLAKDTGYFLYAERKERKITYSDFSPVGSKVRPRKISIELEGGTRIDADVTYDLAAHFDATDFDAIKGSEEETTCSDSRRPLPKSDLPIIVPRDVKSQVKGKIVVDVQVGTNGEVIDDAIVESLEPDLDAIALAKTKKMHFEPGTCDGKPVKSTTEVTLTISKN
jgi:hypothetical protein